MASNLTGADILGASLKNCDPEVLKVAELKLWLRGNRVILAES